MSAMFGFGLDAFVLSPASNKTLSWNCHLQIANSQLTTPLILLEANWASGRIVWGNLNLLLYVNSNQPTLLGVLCSSKHCKQDPWPVNPLPLDFDLVRKMMDFYRQFPSPSRMPSSSPPHHQQHEPSSHTCRSPHPPNLNATVSKRTKKRSGDSRIENRKPTAPAISMHSRQQGNPYLRGYYFVQSKAQAEVSAVDRACV